MTQVNQDSDSRKGQERVRFKYPIAKGSVERGIVSKQTELVVESSLSELAEKNKWFVLNNFIFFSWLELSGSTVKKKSLANLHLTGNSISTTN